MYKPEQIQGMKPRVKQASIVGQSATYRVTPNPKSQDFVDFAVVIVASRLNFGRTDLRIKPAQGTGETWVSSESVKLQEQV